MVQARQAEEKLRAVITFPGGWLLQEEEEEVEMEGEEKERAGELAQLRNTLLPRAVTLLHSVLHSTAQYRKAIGLADLVAGEQHGVYTAFSQQDSRDLLAKVRESSLAAMDQGKDPWGFDKL